ncbi:MAG TPA: peptidyl-prolyl cis-trans isomerase [Solirubrobacterales bacterium]
MSPSKGQRRTSRGGGGAKAKPGAAKRGPDREQARRLGLLVFGVLFLVLFVGFAVAQGLGKPSVPSGSIAIVEDIPDGATAPFDKPFTDCNGDEVTPDLGEITQGEFDCAFEQVVAASGSKKAPKPGSKQFDELKETTTSSMLETIWIQGLAAEKGITVSIEEVEDELKKLKDQNFKTDAEFNEFLETSKYTEQDVNERVKIQVLSTKIQEELAEGAATPSKEEIQEYYDEAKAEQFTSPPTVDARILIVKDQKDAEAAKAALETDDSEANWKTVIEKYGESAAQAQKGGLQEKISEEQFAGPVGKQLFAAPVGTVEGPVKYSTAGYLVFEVEKKNPETVQPLKEAEAQIKSQLGQQSQEAAFNDFVSGFQSLWKSRTFCADGYVIEKCSNFESDGRSPEADPACYEADPKAPAEACPAPVIQAKPALPGTISVVSPKGEALAQRPRPVGLEEGSEALSLEGLPPGVTTGAPPPAP